MLFTDAEDIMRTTVTLDEEIVAKAVKLTGIEEHPSLVRACHGNSGTC